MTAPPPEPRPAGVPRSGRARVWIRRAAIAALAALVLASGAAFWLLERASQGKLTVRLLRIGNYELSRSSNLRVYASRMRVRGGTIDLDTLQVDALEGGRWYRLLDAVHARARGDVRALMTGRPQIFDLHLTSPVFHVVTAQNGRTVTPQFRSSGKKGGRLKDGFHVALDRALIRAHARGDSVEWWEDGTLDARFRPEGKGYDITLSRASGRMPTLGLEVATAAGHAWWATDSLRLTDFVARTDAGAARLSGSLAGRKLDGQFRADRWPWEFFGDLLEQPALDVPGEVSVRGAVLGTVDRPEFRTLLTGHWRDEPFEGVIDGRIVKTGFAVSRADLAWRSARFVGNAEFPRAGRWSIAGRVSDLDLAQVVHLFPGVVLPQSELDGPARIEGSEGSLLISSSGLSGVLMDLPLDGVKGSWRILGRRHRVEAGGTVAGGAIALTGGWDDHTVTLQGTASHADLSRFGTWIPALRNAGGELEETQWSVVGPVGSPRLTLDGRVAAASFPPIDAEAVRFHYGGLWTKTPQGAGRIEARALSSHGWQADTAWALVQHVGREIHVAPLVAERGDTTLFATLDLHPQGDGWLVRADSLRLESDRGWMRAVGPVELESRGGEWTVRRAEIASSSGHLTVTGRARGEEDMDLHVTGRGIVAAQLAEAVGLRGWSGDLAFDAHLVGGGGRRALDLDATATKLVTPTFQVDQGSASIRLTESGGDLDVERLHLQLGSSVLDGSGQARLPDGKWPLDPTRWLAEFRRTRSWRGEIQAKNFDLTDLSAVWPRLDWLSGHVTGTARLGGRPSEPEGETQGTVADLFIRGHRIDPVTWRARYGSSALSIEDLRIGEGDSSAVVHGTVPLDLSWGEGRHERVPDRPMDLRIQAAHVSLGEAATFLPFVAYADGALTADLRVLGTPRRMRPTGTLDVAGARVRFTGREEVYRNVEGRLVFDSTLVRVAHLSATQGKDGTLSGSGTVTLGPDGVEDYDLQVKAVNALALASGEYEAHFDGDFKVDAGPRLGKSWFPLPHASGRLTVRDGVILYDFADPANRVYFAGPRQAPAWVYDVDVTAPARMYWRTPNANVELKADLSVSQTLDDWRVWGSVESLRGSYYFLENKFSVDSGTLQFDQVEPLNPKVDASAHSDVPGSTSETVTITLSGRIRNPTVRLMSSTGLSEQEIVQRLTLGRFGLGLTRDQRYAPGSAEIVAGATGGQYLLRQLAQQFPEVSPLLGDVEVGTQVVQTDRGGLIVPTIGIGRYVTPDVRVRYSQALGTPSTATSGVNVRDLGAEYRISRIFFLTGEILERRTGSSLTPTVSQSELEYNLDLRARYEY